MAQPHFKEVRPTLASEVYKVTKYISERTGFTVVITDSGFKGPMIDCSFLIVTESENDDGYIHILEHLIFNGSQNYPSQVILNELAEDVTGHSEIDHTIFSFSTAGQKSVSTLLPIFLDHIMHPLLSEEDYILDVHHIDGEGKDGGLVYKEMESANIFYNRMEAKLLRESYPDSSYAWDYHGSVTALRTSTTNAKVKEFHKKYYRPENITIILTGIMDHEYILKTLSEFEDDIIAKRNAEPIEEWIKPWQSVPPPPNCGKYSSFHLIGDPNEENQSCNNKYHKIMGWRGPVLSSASSLKELFACDIILDYLTVSSIASLPSAPLHELLVANDRPLAEMVSCNINPTKYSLLRLEIFDIPLEDEPEVDNVVLDYIRSVCSGKSAVDMERMQHLVQIELTDHLKSLNWDSHQDITMRCLTSLYLDRDTEAGFREIMHPERHLNELLHEPAHYWLDIFKKYFTNDVVIVTSNPVGLESEANEEREENIRMSLGEKGLEKKANLLRKAENYRKIREASRTRTRQYSRDGFVQQL